MASSSSRIFVKGLPPTFTEAEFRSHFAQNRPQVTDAKIFPNRRIGYVGYKTADDARAAVKYFNRTFIRMSKIGVELARPVQESRNGNKQQQQQQQRQDAASTPPSQTDRNSKTARPATDDLARNVEEAEDKDSLKKFLDVMKPRSKRKVWEMDGLDEPVATSVRTEQESAAVPAEGASDSEYEVVPKKSKRVAQNGDAGSLDQEVQTDQPVEVEPRAEVLEHTSGNDNEKIVSIDSTAVTDSDWARARTSRLLGLLDEEEEEAAADSKHDRTHLLQDHHDAVEDSGDNKLATAAEETIPTPPSDEHIKPSTPPELSPDVAGVRESMRLFVRNLPYGVRSADLEAEFAPYGHLEEAHAPMDLKTGEAKGFAYLQFSDADSAEQAMLGKDGQFFQGRMLHVLPAAAKRETKLDDFALSKLPLKKQQQIKRRREAAAMTFNWNSLYMNIDTVMSNVADRLGLSKSEVLDPTSNDAAIKQAHAETHVIQETKSYFQKQGVDIDSFKKSQRGDTAILVKNIPYDCSRDELKRLFEEHGELKRFLMPPSGTIAILEFMNAAQCTAAFGAMAYRKVKSSILFLEKAPKGVFDNRSIEPSNAREDAQGATPKASASELREMTVPASIGSATLFVRNLNFSTTAQRFTEVFQPLEGFMSARIKTKSDPKKPGNTLSMGFGFLEFQTSAQAQSALHTMDGHVLDGHKLQIRASHRGVDAAEERRKEDAAARASRRNTKIIIKNLPFETTKKDVRALFGAYGQLRSVRVPQKMNRTARGFAFADFLTPKEAESAMQALKDTHLLGRRLVLELAAEDPEDAEAEIEKMQRKVGRQVNKVALQKLTGKGRTKFTTHDDEEE